MNDEREEGRAARALAETLPAPLSSSPASRDEGASPTLLAGRYEVQGLLGGGAMGAVYRAFDRALEEAIALKVLRRELARDPDALERFRREVKLARRVTHANVARTFDLGESDGELFLTMELVLGESLGARLAREGALPLAEAARITGEVVRGLVAAHAADVVHRDLKPDNVMLDGARVVITDFGVARAVARGDARRSMGVTGTPAYMAPEQVEGRADVDGRADFYALGVMLFEMLTGELPFDGDSALAIAAARLTREAPDVTTFAPALPAAARDLVGDLLVRDRAHRLTDPSALLARVDALSRSDADAPPSRRRGPSAAEISRRERTVAVMPFSNRGVEADLYLAEGLAEDVVDALSVVSGVRVRPLSQVRELAGRDARDAGRILGVDVVVEGSVRREGERLRMSVRLITVQDGFQLWAKRLIVEPGALSSLGDQIADEVAGALAAPRTAHAGPVGAEAYDLFLRGKFICDQGWIENHAEGVGLLAQAQALAPGDARIAGRLAVELARGTGVASDRHDPRLSRAKEMAKLAESLDRSRAEPPLSRAVLHWWWTDYDDCLDALDEALHRDPDNADALLLLGRLVAESGDLDGGVAVLRRSVRLAPGLASARAALARTYDLLGERDSAAQELAASRGRPAEQIQVLLAQARHLLWHRDVAGARAFAESLAPVPLPPYATLWTQGILDLLVHGLTPEAFAAIEPRLPIDTAAPSRRAFFAHLRAEVLAVGGHLDLALGAVEAADAFRTVDVAWMDGCPLLAELRGAPGFVASRGRIAERADALRAHAGPIVRRLA